MAARYSLRLKVALGFSLFTAVLLFAQALSVRSLAGAQQDSLIKELIADDVNSLLRSLRLDPGQLPPFSDRFHGYVTFDDGDSFELPAWVGSLKFGTQEIKIADRAIYVAIVPFDGARLYRIYDFGDAERRFNRVIDGLMVGTGLFAFVTIWLAYLLSGLLVRQVALLAASVKTLRADPNASIVAGKYDEIEVVELADAVNTYHRRLAQMIDREKAFTANVSHELRTPLTAIKTSCEMLLSDGSLTPAVTDRIEGIERAADRMVGLINSLLLLAREGTTAETGPVVLSVAVSHALESCSRILADRHVVVEVAVDPRVRVNVNSAALGIVLSNLLANAAAYATNSEVFVKYHSGRLDIRDRGAGIPRRDIPKVFDRYYRGDAAKSATPGLGLGLSITKAICVRFDWGISLVSDEGSGTTVSLVLPTVE